MHLGDWGVELKLCRMEDDAPATPADPHIEHALASSVLVLNRHYLALRVVSARRAFILLYKNFAEAVDAHNGTFSTFDFGSWARRSRDRDYAPVDHEQFIRTPRMSLLVPRVIRLVTYDRVPRSEIKFSRRNIIARDENRCQYCGRRLGASHLSIDHIVPKSRGGKSSWTNVVAACMPCNTRKGGRLPAEASMRLLRPPTVPRKNPMLADKMRSTRYEIWKFFLRDGELAIDGTL